METCAFVYYAAGIAAFVGLGVLLFTWASSDWGRSPLRTTIGTALSVGGLVYLTLLMTPFRAWAISIGESITQRKSTSKATPTRTR